MRRSALHLAGNLAPVLSGLLTAPLTARSLGVDARGQITLILLVSTAITVVGNFGLSWVARADVANDSALAIAWNRLGLRAAFAMLPFALITGVVLALNMRLAPFEVVAVLVLFTLSSLSASRGVTANVLIALGHIDFFGRANLVMTLSVVTTIVVSFLFGHLNLAVAVSATSVGLIVQLILLGIGFRIAKSRLPTFADRRSARAQLTFRGVFSRASKSWISQLAETLLGRADVILVSSQATTYQLGLYSVVVLIPQIAYQVYSTLIQRSYARSPKEALTSRTTLLWIACMVSAVVMAVIAVPAAYWLIPVVFGEPFAAARAFLFPAAGMVFGLATLAPLVNDVALRRRAAPYFASAVVVALAVALVAGHLTSVQVGLFSLALLFMLLSVGYVAAINRGRITWVRLQQVIALLRGR